MSVSYDKLFVILAKQKLQKTDLAKAASLAPATLAKLSKNEPVSLAVVERICRYLNVQPGDLLSYVPEQEVSPLLERLLSEKKNGIKGGIYHQTQIVMTYNSNHIEGSKLTEDQTRLIYETNTLLPENTQGVPVDDVIETANHFVCIRYILDHVFDPLNEPMIKELHRILKTGTHGCQRIFSALCKTRGELQMSKRRPYVRSMDGWWKKNPYFIEYMIHEGTALFVAAYALVLLVGLVRLSQGEVAWNSWLEALKSPVSLVFHLLILVMLVPLYFPSKLLR